MPEDEETQIKTVYSSDLTVLKVEEKYGQRNRTKKVWGSRHIFYLLNQTLVKTRPEEENNKLL
jgi:hypothetical protein